MTSTGTPVSHFCEARVYGLMFKERVTYYQRGDFFAYGYTDVEEVPVNGSDRSLLVNVVTMFALSEEGLDHAFRNFEAKFSLGLKRIDECEITGIVEQKAIEQN